MVCLVSIRPGEGAMELYIFVSTAAFRASPTVGCGEKYTAGSPEGIVLL